jgi:hypothetical protein
MNDNSPSKFRCQLCHHVSENVYRTLSRPYQKRLDLLPSTADASIVGGSGGGSASGVGLND